MLDYHHQLGRFQRGKCFSTFDWGFQQNVGDFQSPCDGVGRGLIGVCSPSLQEVPYATTRLSTGAVRITAD